jgi:hypothetical protein
VVPALKALTPWKKLAQRWKDDSVCLRDFGAQYWRASAHVE